MNSFYSTLLKGICLILTGAALLFAQPIRAQSCTPQGDQLTYGTNNTWIGYVYQGMNFNTYKGYVTEGSPASPNFDESFGGDQVNYATNGCPVYTDTFSVVYKLTQSFAYGDYLITVGASDGYKLSINGGASRVISNWQDQSYTTTTYEVTLSGSYNIILQYYNHFGPNRVSFNITPSPCTGTGNPSVYGTNNVWNGYIYKGMAFDAYKGEVTEGSTYSPNFYENYGTLNGTPVTYNTSSCSVQTYQFSGHYRLRQTFTPGNYSIIAGGDDGFRLSLDGGNTWVINGWGDHVYAIASYTDSLSGTYDMVLDYYQDAGYSVLSFNMASTVLPITLVKWSASALPGDNALLQWQTASAISFDHFEVQRSTDGVLFKDIQKVAYADSSDNPTRNYSYTDQYTWGGDLYYRLAMIDHNGAISYSAVAVLPRSATQTVKIYPTLVENGSLFVSSTQTISQAKLELFDMNGRKILQKNWATLTGPEQLSLQSGSIGNLPAGAYFARLSDSHTILAKQVIIIN
jgi:hypothetical protein